MKKMTKTGGVFLSMAILAACSCSCGKKNSGPPPPPDSAVEFPVDANTVVSANFVGFGTQYNQNVYSTFSSTDGITPGNIGKLEEKVKALHSQYVRIFFDSKAWPTDPNYSATTADFMSS